MRLDKWAVTAQEALQAALGIAGDVEASEVAPTHLLKALLDSNERNLRSILEKIGADPDTIATQVDQAISKAPKVRLSTRPRNLPLSWEIPTLPPSTCSLRWQTTTLMQVGFFATPALLLSAWKRSTTSYVAMSA